jgi:hypothetical protein
MQSKILITLIIFIMLFLPYIRRVYLINLYPDGIPNYGSTTVFIITFILITLFQLKNHYYPPKIPIFQRLMDNSPTFAKVVIFSYNGLQATYYKPMKEFNTYMLRFSGATAEQYATLYPNPHDVNPADSNPQMTESLNKDFKALEIIIKNAK